MSTFVLKTKRNSQKQRKTAKSGLQHEAAESSSGIEEVTPMK
jgi:hypothetical protein